MNILKVCTFLKNRFIGIKNLEFKIWSRTLKFHNRYDYIVRAQYLLRRLESIRPDTPNHENIIVLSWKDRKEEYNKICNIYIYKRK